MAYTYGEWVQHPDFDLTTFPGSGGAGDPLSFARTGFDERPGTILQLVETITGSAIDQVISRWDYQAQDVATPPPMTGAEQRAVIDAARNGAGPQQMGGDVPPGWYIRVWAQPGAGTMTFGFRLSGMGIKSPSQLFYDPGPYPEGAVDYEYHPDDGQRYTLVPGTRQLRILHLEGGTGTPVGGLNHEHELRMLHVDRWNYAYTDQGGSHFGVTDPPTVLGPDAEGTFDNATGLPPYALSDPISAELIFTDPLLSLDTLADDPDLGRVAMVHVVPKALTDLHGLDWAYDGATNRDENYTHWLVPAVQAVMHPPRFRWIYERVPGAPIVRVHPRDDGRGTASAARVYPPPRSQQGGSRTGPGSYW